MVEPDGPQKTIWPICIACWIPKATKTHSVYVINIDFPLQQWLRERGLMLRSTYIVSPVITEMECVYCAVRTESSHIIQVNVSLYRVA